MKTIINTCYYIASACTITQVTSYFEVTKSMFVAALSIINSIPNEYVFGAFIATSVIYLHFKNK